MLYHANLGLPEGLQLPSGDLPLRYTSHALEEAEADRLGPLDQLPEVLDTATARVVEVETYDKVHPVKVVFRVKYDHWRALLLAVEPETGRVRTVWANRLLDRHSTLDKRRYARP